MPWQPPIYPPRPTDGRGRCPGASVPPQTGGPAHQPGQLAPSAVRPCGLAGAGRGPAPPAPMAPPGAPSRCPAGPLALAGLLRCGRACPPPLPCSGLGPLIVRAPPPPGPGLRLPLRGPGPWSVPAPAPCLGLSARALPRLGAAGAAPLPARCAAWGRRRAGRCSCAAAPWGGPPQPRPLRAALARPCCPPGGPVSGGPPCGCCGLPLAGDPSGLRAPFLRAGGPLARCAGPWAAPRPPGWRSRAGAPWAIRPMVRWCGGGWRGAQAYKAP